MLYRLSAEAVLLLHLCFILFVLLGALLTVRWRWIAPIHLLAAAWACFVELSGRVCPLTYAENYLWIRAGRAAYSQDFVQHYLVPLIYPPGLTPRLQSVLAVVVVCTNVLFYGWLLIRRRAAQP
jgi:Protein of Unknown function (DUF2784)